MPIYLIDAPARGTGKGLLSEVASLITLGYPAPVMSQPRDGDELEKRITTVLLEGRQIVFLDNVTRLDSPHLAAALTAEIWQGRILGKSEIVTVPNRATWLTTGNNVEIADELARRIIPIPIRLDAGVERPEERKGFKHANLPIWVKDHRSDLVSACLSLIQAWLDAGQPRGAATLGRYEAWAGILGGILGVSGVSGFSPGANGSTLKLVRRRPNGQASVKPGGRPLASVLSQLRYSSTLPRIGGYSSTSGVGEMPYQPHSASGMDLP